MINNKIKARHKKSSLKKIICFVFVFLFSFLFCFPFLNLKTENKSIASASAEENLVAFAIPANKLGLVNGMQFTVSVDEILGASPAGYNPSLNYELIGYQLVFSYKVVWATFNCNVICYYDSLASNSVIYGSDGDTVFTPQVSSNLVQCLVSGENVSNIRLTYGLAFFYVDSSNSGYTEEEYLQYGENQFQAGFDEANKVYVNYSDTITLNSSNLEFTYNLDDYISIDDIDFEIKRKYTTIAGGSGSGDIQQGEIVENVDTFTDTFTLIELTTYSGGVNPGGQLLGDNYSSVRLGYNSTDNNLTFYFLGSDKAEVTFVINGYRYPYTFDEVEDLEDNSYNNGYNNGLSFGYENGLLQGSSEGFDLGYSQGFDAGESSALNSNETFADMIFAIVDAPFNVLNNAFDFTFFGINVANFLMVVVSLILVAFVVKKLL